MGAKVSVVVANEWDKGKTVDMVKELVKRLEDGRVVGVIFVEVRPDGDYQVGWGSLPGGNREAMGLLECAKLDLYTKRGKSCLE